MSIRVRLILSYLAMLIVPIVLGILAVTIIFHSFSSELNALKSLYNVEFDHESSPLDDWMQKLNKVSSEVRALAARKPDAILERSRQEEWDRRLNQIHSSLIVRKNNEFVYVSPFLQDTKLLEQLPPFGAEYVESHDNWIHSGNWVYTINHDDVLFSDQSRGTVFYVTDRSPLTDFVRKLAVTVITTLLLILVLTNGVLTWLVSRSIIRPLRTLTQAAKQIQQGNLNFHVQPTGRDELGALCVAFEEMRAKLKESIDLQVQYEENRKELVSHISHDLKTPVTAIKGYVEGILDGVADSPEKMQKYLSTIYQKAGDLDRLIDELFLFSKLDLKRMPFDFERVEIERFVKDIVEEFRFDLEQTGIELRLEGSLSRNVMVILDREKMKRVITNILDNAVKYMNRADGCITVRLSEEKETVTVRVEDNGQGIDPESLPHIFERFYRAESSRSRETGGSGLGLAIAKQIVEGHGGRIGAESKTGQGTVIWFRLNKAE